MLSRSLKASLRPFLPSRDRCCLYSSVAISNFDSQTINYDHMERNINIVRKKLGRPLNLTEKLLAGHQQDASSMHFTKEHLSVYPDRVACQDTTAPMVLLQFMNTGLPQVAIPTTVHCDHQVETHMLHPYYKTSPHHQKRRPLADLGRAQSLLHHQVDSFLGSTCDAFNIGLWRPGSGLLHQIMLEKYAFPGSLIIGTDSRMSHAGGLASLSFSVGGAEALDAMVGLPWDLRYPKVVGVNLKGSLSSWVTSKDVILKLHNVLSKQALGNNMVVEYMGSGSNTLSCTGMATICNMGTDTNAISSVFPYSDKMDVYLRATSRQAIANAAQSRRTTILRADENATYDHMIDLDLSALEPHIYGPFTPDVITPLSKFKQHIIEKQKDGTWSPTIQAAHIGSCSNSSYQDLARSASLAQQAIKKGLSFKTSVSVTPGSTQIRSTLDRDGATKIFKDAGAALLANASGPCISTWNKDRPQYAALETTGAEDQGDDRQQLHGTGSDTGSILSSYNLDISDGMDGKSTKDYFIASTELVTAMAFANSLLFNPLTDSIIGKDGKPFKFQPPQDISIDGIPGRGFVADDSDIATFYQKPSTTKKIDPATLVAPNSTQLERLIPFTPPSWTAGTAFHNIPVLFKAKGVCSSEEISRTGHWLKYRGHLDNLSNNLLIGAVNAENGKRNWIKNRMTGLYDDVPRTARQYKQCGIPWVLIAEEQYGQGSASEHGALEFRYLNGVAIIAKSFAPHHELNLKKQGILPLQFVDPMEYDKIDGDASVTLDYQQLEPGKPLHLQVLSSIPETASRVLELSHTFNQEQINWFRAGSALNLIVSRIQAAIGAENTVVEA